MQILHSFLHNRILGSLFFITEDEVLLTASFILCVPFVKLAAAAIAACWQESAVIRVPGAAHAMRMLSWPWVTHHLRAPTGPAV